MAGQALYYGMNALSHNVIMADRKKLKSANGMYSIVSSSLSGATSPSLILSASFCLLAAVIKLCAVPIR